MPYTGAVKRLAIVEYVMSAGGVERVLRGLARAFLDIPEAREWDITFLLSRFNSARSRCEWPADLTGPGLKVEWLGERTALGRALDPLAHLQGVAGVRATRVPAYAFAKAARAIGPLAWRAALGDPYALIARESARFDVVYFTYPFWMTPPPIQAPVASTPQDFNFKHFTGPKSFQRRANERWTRAWLARSDRLLLSSHAVEAELQQFYPEHADRAQVVHLGVDVDREAPSPAAVEDVRRARRLPAEFMLVTGLVVPHKGQTTVIEAAALLRAKARRLPIVFVGPNTAHLTGELAPGFRTRYVEEVRAALTRHGLEPERDFWVLGYVADAELQALFRAATVFVSASSYEGFGLPSLEAMRAGCPVLLSKIPPYEEQDRLLGGILRTFPPGDAPALARELEWLLSHRDEAAASARLAAERVPAVYDWKKTARAYLAAFDELIARRRGSPALPRSSSAPRPPS